MTILTKSISGSLESNDILIELYPNDDGVIIEIESIVKDRFFDQIKSSIEETLKIFNIDKIKVSVKDKGAIDCTIKARLETAIKRAKVV
ncbi:MAG: citrate lyase acyl carrier protein [Oscillospiraceae bacterium]